MYDTKMRRKKVTLPALQPHNAGSVLFYVFAVEPDSTSVAFGFPEAVDRSEVLDRGVVVRAACRWFSCCSSCRCLRQLRDLVGLLWIVQVANGYT